MDVLKIIIASVVSGLIVAGLGALVNRSIFKAIDEIKNEIKEIFITLRKEIPTNEKCKEEAIELTRIDAELNLHGKQLSGYGARLMIVEKNIDKLQAR